MISAAQRNGKTLNSTGNTKTKAMKPAHRNSPAEADALRNACVAGIADSLEVKAIADKTGICQTYVRTLLKRMGYAKVILSVDERWIIAQIRAKKGRFVAFRRP